MQPLETALVVHFLMSGLISLSVAFYFFAKGVSLLRRKQP